MDEFDDVEVILTLQGIATAKTIMQLYAGGMSIEEIVEEVDGVNHPEEVSVLMAYANYQGVLDTIESLDHDMWRVDLKKVRQRFDDAADESNDLSDHDELHAAASVVEIVSEMASMPDPYIQKWLEGLYDRL